MKQMPKENFLYGMRPLIEAINSGKEIDKILIQKGLKNELYSELMGLLSDHSIPYQIVPVQKLNRITRKNHQGVIGFVSEVPFQRIDDILPVIFENGEVPLLLILEGITDVRNFGAIARSAECAGVHAIIIPIRGAAQVNADAMKTSAGALNKIPVCREKNLYAVVDYLKQSGVKIIAASEKAKNFHFQTKLDVPAGIVMGSEEKGVTPALLEKCDEIVKIPMRGEIASLNVSVAAGIFVFEALRQRLGK